MWQLFSKPSRLCRVFMRDRTCQAFDLVWLGPRAWEWRMHVLTKIENTTCWSNARSLFAGRLDTLHSSSSKDNPKKGKWITFWIELKIKQNILWDIIIWIWCLEVANLDFSPKINLKKFKSMKSLFWAEPQFDHRDSFCQVILLRKVHSLGGALESRD